MRIAEPIVTKSLLPASVAPSHFVCLVELVVLECRGFSGQLESMILILLTAFGAVFVAEIVGDKLLYTTGVLATRYRSLSIVLGMMAAFMIKMGVAVGVGAAISQLPRALVATVTGASFVGVALT